MPIFFGLPLLLLSIAFVPLLGLVWFAPKLFLPGLLVVALCGLVILLAAVVFEGETGWVGWVCFIVLFSWVLLFGNTE